MIGEEIIDAHGDSLNVWQVPGAEAYLQLQVDQEDQERGSQHAGVELDLEMVRRLRAALDRFIADREAAAEAPEAFAERPRGEIEVRPAKVEPRKRKEAASA